MHKSDEFYFVSRLVARSPKGSGGKKNRQKERRLMKGFNLGTGSQAAGSSSPCLPGGVVAQHSSSSVMWNRVSRTIIAGESMSSENVPKRSPLTRLAQLARLARAKKMDSKKKWGNLIEAAKTSKGVSKIWSRSQDSLSSDGSAGSAPATPAVVMSAATTRLSINLTENELPEVVEETAFEGELVGRMASATRSPRYFRRTSSEPVSDHVTLVVESVDTHGRHSPRSTITDDPAVPPVADEPHKSFNGGAGVQSLGRNMGGWL